MAVYFEDGKVAQVLKNYGNFSGVITKRESSRPDLINPKWTDSGN